LTLSVFLSTIIPILFLAGLLKRENRMLILFFCWGLIAFLAASYANGVISKNFRMSHTSMAVSVAPIVEEFLKFLPLLTFLFLKKTKDKFAILYYGMAIGIGFSIQENYLYLNQYKVFNRESVLMLVILRGISTSLMHGLTTAIVGFGLCVVKDFKVFTFPLTFGLLALAIVSHSLFNLYINSDMKIIGLIMPLAVYIISLTALHSLDEFKENSE